MKPDTINAAVGVMAVVGAIAAVGARASENVPQPKPKWPCPPKT